MSTQQQLFTDTETQTAFVPPDRDVLLTKLRLLKRMHKCGLLGGDQMPEDANPGLPKNSKENYLFFTLAMALNYQRNSYALWPAATRTYRDPKTRFVFDPIECCDKTPGAVKNALLEYGLALQPKRHTEIWMRISRTFRDTYEGDVRNLLAQAEWSVASIRRIVQHERKPGFPYLSGPKICNYWLYVLEQYTTARFTDRGLISVAPDTHVVQSTFKLQLLSPTLADASDLQERVAAAWAELLMGSEFLPIDIHTPLWLWSRKGFPTISV